MIARWKVTNVNVGDLVLRNTARDRDGYNAGTVVEVAGDRVQVAWPANRIGGSGYYRTWLQARSLIVTSDAVIAQRRGEALHQRWSQSLPHVVAEIEQMLAAGQTPGQVAHHFTRRLGKTTSAIRNARHVAEYLASK